MGTTLWILERIVLPIIVILGLACGSALYSFESEGIVITPNTITTAPYTNLPGKIITNEDIVYDTFDATPSVIYHSDTLLDLEWSNTITFSSDTGPISIESDGNISFPENMEISEVSKKVWQGIEKYILGRKDARRIKLEKIRILIVELQKLDE